MRSGGAPTRSPADLGRLGAGSGLPREAGPVRVGGRVRFEGELLWLVDALARCRVTLRPGAERPREGQLAVVEGTVELPAEAGGTDAAPSLREAHVTWQSASACPGPDVSRIADRGVGRALVARVEAATALRSWFQGEGFLEVETPSRVPCPGLDLHLDAFGVEGDAGGPPRWLSTSPEMQMKRLLVGGVPRCFQLARSFRRGERGDRHEPEFTMLEWYRAFAGLDEVIADTEAICQVVAAAVGSPGALTVDRRRIALPRPFPRVSVAEAFAAHAGTPPEETLRLAHEDEDGFFRLLVERVEPALASLPHALVLHRFPLPFASLARACDDDPRWAERFEVYVGGLELCNGFGELTDPSEQRARFERDRSARAATGRDVYPLDERFLGALVEGMPPSAGNALGFDRLLAAALGLPRIADVLAVPEVEL